MSRRRDNDAAFKAHVALAALKGRRTASELAGAYGIHPKMIHMDSRSREVLAWRISNTQKAGVCVDALNETINRFGAPDIMNTNRGPPFTSFALTDRLKWAGTRISTDGKLRCSDNISPKCCFGL
jgi:transposase InsO family protein